MRPWNPNSSRLSAGFWRLRRVEWDCRTETVFDLALKKVLRTIAPGFSIKKPVVE